MKKLSQEIRARIIEELELGNIWDEHCEYALAKEFFSDKNVSPEIIEKCMARVIDDLIRDCFLHC